MTTATKKEVTIPLTAAFQERFAELVWECCPELARTTVAGKLALSLEFDHEVVMGIVLSQMRPSIDEWVKEQALDLKEEILESLDIDLISSSHKEQLQEDVRNLLMNTNLANEVGKRIRCAVDTEVTHQIRDAVSEYFGGNNESLQKIVQSRIDAYLARRLDGEETSRAIADGMHRMVASDR